MVNQIYYCPYCNAQVSYGVGFCQNCGNQLYWTNEQWPQTTGNSPQSEKPAKEHKAASKASTYVLISVIIVSIFLIGGALSFNFVMSELGTKLPKTATPSATPTTVSPTKATMHTISLDEINSNPAYWNLSWQGKEAELQKTTLAVNTLYFKTHTYIAGQTDCNDMAVDIWNMLVKYGIVSIIVAGNLDRDNYSFNQCSHAWLLVFALPKGASKPASFALEATNGQLYFADDAAHNAKINRYWSGFFYSKPSDLRTDVGSRW